MTLTDPDLFREAALIDRQWIVRADMEVASPATGTAMGTMPDCTADETTRAILAAERAMKAWKACTHSDRADLLMRWHDLDQPHLSGPF